MKKRDFETYQKRFRDFEILPKFSETHVFRGTIRHPFFTAADYLNMTVSNKKALATLDTVQTSELNVF